MYRPNDMRRSEFSSRQQKYMNNLLILCTPKRRKSEFYCFVNSIQLTEHINTEKARYKDDCLEILRFFDFVSLVKTKCKTSILCVPKESRENKKSNLQSSESRSLSFFATNEII